MKEADAVTARTTTIANVTVEEAGSSTACAATLAAKSVARNRGICKRNASIASGGTMKNATAGIIEESGRTRSAHSSSTTGARGWNGSQLPRIARSVPPNRTEIDAHQCSRGSDTRHHLHRARCHPSGTRRRNPIESARNATSRSGARTVSPNHRRGESNVCAVWSKPKKTTFGC